MSRLIIFGVFIAVVGFGLTIWNGNSGTSQKKTIVTVSESNQMSHQLKAFLDDDQSNNLDKEQKLIEDAFEKETTNSGFVQKKINPSSQNRTFESPVKQSLEKKWTIAKQFPKKSIVVKKSSPKKPLTAKQPPQKKLTVVKKSSSKKPLTAKQLPQKKLTVVKKSSPKKPLIAKQPPQKKPTVVREFDQPNLVASRKAAKYITTFANQPSKKPLVIRKKTDISSSNTDKEPFSEEEEIAYQDAYKRSFYENPYDREYVLENVEAYHGDLASALTKLDIDRAVRNNELEKLQQWLKILTIAKYPLEQKRLTQSYSGTKAYIKSAIRQLLN